MFVLCKKQNPYNIANCSINTSNGYFIFFFFTFLNSSQGFGKTLQMIKLHFPLFCALGKCSVCAFSLLYLFANKLEICLLFSY